MSSFITKISSTGHTVPAIVSTIIASGGLLASVTCAVIAVAIFPAAMIPLIIGAAIGLAAAAAGVIAFIYIARASGKSYKQLCDESAESQEKFQDNGAHGGKPTESQKDFANSNLSTIVKEEIQNDGDDFSKNADDISSEEILSSPKIKEPVSEEQLCDEFNELLAKFREDGGHIKFFRLRILGFFEKFQSSPLAELLTKLDNKGNGWTLPMIIMRYGTTDVQMGLLNLLKKLDPALRKKVLRQQSGNGWNMLMYALCYGNDGVRIAALELLGELVANAHVEILKQQNNDKWNMFMFALFKGSDEVRTKALELLGKLNANDRVEILRQQDESGRNILMVALFYGDAKVQMAALELLGEPGANARVEILRQQNNDGWNMLTFALFKGSNEVQTKVLELLGKPGANARAETLK